MKSKHLLLTLFLALLVPWAANAQDRTIVTIGDGTSTTYVPLPGWYGWQYEVYLYTPEASTALSVDCEISSIAYNVSNDQTATGAEMTIWVKDVDANYALAAATTFTDYTTGATQVYTNDEFSSTTGWNTFTFTSAFSHEGGKALLVAVKGVGCTTGGGCSRQCYYTSATGTHWYKRQDNSDPGTTVSGSLDANRSNIQLNITYTGTPCFAPSGLTATLTPGNGTVAALAWEENGTATSWVLQYGTDNTFAAGTYEEMTVNTNPTQELTGLTAEQIYYARVRPDCSETAWSATCSFWPTSTVEVVVNNGTTTNSYIPFYGYGVSSSYGMPNKSQFIIPATNLENINPGSTIKMLTLHSSTANANWGAATFNVYLKEVTNNNFASATFVEDGLTTVYQGTLTLGNNKMEIIMSQDFVYQGGNLLVGFELTATGTGASCSWYGVNGSNNAVYTYVGYSGSVNGPTLSNFMPKVTFRVLQAEVTCDKPKNLAASDINHEQATITWTSDESAWNIAWSTDPEFDPATAPQGSSANNIPEKTYTITGLSSLTDYYVAVQSACGGDWSNKLHFKTTAVAVAVGDAWSDDFEGESCGWELLNGTQTNQWAWGTAASNGGTHGLYVSNDEGTSNAYTNTSASTVYATKLLSFAQNKYTIEYDWKSLGESTWDYVRAVLAPASAELTAGTLYSGLTYSSLPTGWIAIGTYHSLQGSTWQRESAVVDIATAGSYYLVLLWRNDGGGGTQPPAAVDNVSITRVTCPYDVTGLAVSNITTSGATLSWTAGEATGWQVAYSTNSSFENATEVIVEEASYIMPELTSATTYYVKVRAYCGGEDFGAWSSVISFPTECEALTEYPYTENFDSYTAATGFLPVCWDRINTGSNSTYNKYPYVIASNSHSASNCLYFYTYGSSSTTTISDQYAILPPMENLAGKQITLMAKGYNNQSTFKIGTMTDPGDVTTFTAIATQALTTSYQEFVYDVPATATDSYIAIMMEKPDASSGVYRGVYIDNITINVPPTCVKPSDLEFVSATTTSATIRWTNGAEGQTAWQIAYSTDPAFNPDEVTPVDVTENPATIEGLTVATIYYAYVRANCGNDGYSDWSAAYVRFITECEAVTDLPWSENFDVYTGSTSTSAPTGYPNDPLPTCWQFLNRSENTSTYPQVFISSNSGYPVSGNCLFFKSSSSTPLYAILPEFSEDIANLQLTFTYRNEGTTTSNGQLIVGYMTDPTDATTFVTLQTCERTTTLTEVEVLFTNAPTGSYIVFMYQGGTSNNYYLSIDNVSVNYPPTCVKPSGLELVNATATSATIRWTNGAEGQTAWQIAYSTDPAFDPDEVTPVDVTENPATIDGLTAATTYYAYVRTNCGDDEYSDWSGSYVQFATECDVITVAEGSTYAYDFESETPWGCWTNVAGTNGRTSGNNNTPEGTYKLQFKGTTTGNIVAMPAFTPDINGLMLTFWTRPEGYTYSSCGTFSVGYMTDLDDASTFVAVDTYSYDDWTENAYVEKTAVFTDAPAGAYIAFCHNALSTIYYWFVDDVEVSVAAPATVTQTTQLVAGWNWFSVSVEMDPSEALAALETALGTSGIQIKSRSGKYTEYDDEDEEWFGTLTSLTNEEMYLIELTAGCTVELEGMPANPAEHAITINHGWNWIGFPSAEEISVEDALSGYEAEEDDQLKSRNNGYTDFDGDEWFGTLRTLVPGQGYMYWSEGADGKTLVIQVGAKSRRQ